MPCKTVDAKCWCNAQWQALAKRIGAAIRTRNHNHVDFLDQACDLLQIRQRHKRQIRRQHQYTIRAGALCTAYPLQDRRIQTIFLFAKCVRMFALRQRKHLIGTADDYDGGE